jgi:hypothetical protein
MRYLVSDRSYALFVQPIRVVISLYCHRCDASSTIRVVISLYCHRCDASSTIRRKVMQEHALGSARNYCDSQGSFWVRVQKNCVVLR